VTRSPMRLLSAAALLPAVLGFTSSADEILDPDYIVVGSGAAGATVAAQLAEANYKVVLLEEGPDVDDDQNYTPVGTTTGPLAALLADVRSAASGLTQFQDETISRNMFSNDIWEFEREPGTLRPSDVDYPDPEGFIQKIFFSLFPDPGEFYVGQIHLYWLQDAVGSFHHAGGLPEGSAIQSFEHTAKIVGGCTQHNFQIWIRPNTESWDDLNSSLWSADVINEQWDELEEGLVHKGGCYNCSYGDPPTALGMDSLKDAAIAGGFTAVDEGRYVASTRLEAGAIARTEYTTDPNTGYRYTSATRFLTQEMRARPNFYLRPNSKVSKIVISDGKATGVEYVDTETGAAYSLPASAEVIVAGGTLATPQILQLSGIGDPEHLDALGIEVVKALPGVGKNLQNHLLIPMFVELPWQGANAAPFAKVELIAQWDSKFAKTAGASDAQFICLFVTNNIAQSRSNMQCYVSRQSGVKSTGTVTLASTDHFDHPVLDVGYFQGEGAEDVDFLVSAIQDMRDKVFANTEEYVVTRPTIDEDLASYVKETASSYWHWTGTAKMGVESDPDAVVNERLQVFGISNLRVVDNSVIGTISNVNTQPTAYMVGWNGAKIILEDAPALRRRNEEDTTHATPTAKKSGTSKNKHEAHHSEHRHSARRHRHRHRF